MKSKIYSVAVGNFQKLFRHSYMILVWNSKRNSFEKFPKLFCGLVSDYVFLTLLCSPERLSKNLSVFGILKVKRKKKLEMK